MSVLMKSLYLGTTLTGRGSFDALSGAIPGLGAVGWGLGEMNPSGLRDLDLL